MKTSIFIVSAFSGGLDGSLNNRFVYLSNLLSIDNEVKLITTDFFHSKKSKIDNTHKFENFDIVSFSVPTYKTNISLKRLWSHLVFAYKVWIYLKKHTHKDSIVYCSFPPIFVALFSFFATKNKKRFILDVQDLWPEVFYSSSNNKLLKKLFKPHRFFVSFLSKRINNLIAVSNTYLSHFKSIGFKGNNATVVYIGTHYNKEAKKAELNNDQIIFIYAGTIGHSYNLSHFVKCFASAQNSIGLKKQIKLIIIGSGPKEIEVKNIAQNLKADVSFTGRIAHDEVMNYLNNAHVAVNSVAPNMQQSIINKHGDYVISGLPILSTQDNEEFKSLVSDYKIGVNVNPQDEKELEEAIIRLANNDFERNEFKQNSMKMGLNLFNREISYLKIKDVINSIKYYDN